MAELARYCGNFRTLSCRFVVRLKFGIPKKVRSLRRRALSNIFSLFLGGDVSDNWSVLRFLQLLL